MDIKGTSSLHCRLMSMLKFHLIAKSMGHYQELESTGPITHCQQWFSIQPRELHLFFVWWSFWTDVGHLMNLELPKFFLCLIEVSPVNNNLAPGQDVYLSWYWNRNEMPRHIARNCYWCLPSDISVLL